TVVVEIAERLVMITGPEPVAISRVAQPHCVADEVAGLIAGIAAGVVLIDAPSTVVGAPALGTAMAAAVRRGGRAVGEIGDARLPRLARSTLSVPDELSEVRCTGDTGGVRARARLVLGLAGAAVVVAALSLAISAVVVGDRGGGPPPPIVQTAPTT